MAVRFMQELDDHAGASGVRLEAVVRPGLANLAEADRLAHETDRFGHLAQRQRDAVHAANRERLGDIAGYAGRTLIEIGLDQVELDAAGVMETLAPLVKARGDGVVVGNAHRVEAGAPEIERASRHRVVDDPDLARAGARRDPFLPERERCHQGTRVAVGIAVVEVIDRVLAVQKNSLLDEALPQQLDVKIHILLRVSHAGGQMMKSLDHRHCPLHLSIDGHETARSRSYATA
ncbi:hypothetical protein D3C87_1162480 [compost metagenome]